MKKDKINWLGKNYPALYIVIFKDTPEEREILVSTTDLEVVLLEDIEGSIAAHDAIALDEVIAYYIEPEEVLLPEEEIVELIERAYAV